MRYRKLDANGDYSFGAGLQNFWIDVPDAPAQAAMTRLALWEGEWFLNIPDGTRWKTQVLGRYTESTRDIEVRLRILDTPGINSILAYNSSLDRNTRKWQVQATLDTVYGVIAVAGPR